MNIRLVLLDYHVYLIALMELNAGIMVVEDSVQGL